MEILKQFQEGDSNLKRLIEQLLVDLYSDYRLDQKTILRYLPTPGTAEELLISLINLSEQLSFIYGAN